MHPNNCWFKIYHFKSIASAECRAITLKGFSEIWHWKSKRMHFRLWFSDFKNGNRDRENPLNIAQTRNAQLNNENLKKKKKPNQNHFRPCIGLYALNLFPLHCADIYLKCVKWRRNDAFKTNVFLFCCCLAPIEKASFIVALLSVSQLQESLTIKVLVFVLLRVRKGTFRRGIV